MTGKEVITYILQNNLENADASIIFESLPETMPEEKPYFNEDGFLVHNGETYVSTVELAKAYGVGTATIQAWAKAAILRKVIVFENELYFPAYYATNPDFIKRLEEGPYLGRKVKKDCALYGTSEQLRKDLGFFGSKGGE